MTPAIIAIIVLLGILLVLATLNVMYSAHAAMTIDKCGCGNSNNGIPINKNAAAVRGSYPAVWEDLATQTRGGAVREGVDQGECATRCGAACMGNPDMYVSEHCARMCAGACGFDFS